jgi:uncharacterized membrane protein
VNLLLGFFGSKVGLVVCMLLAVLGIYLLGTHTGHVFAALPYLILLACPLMHFFGHGHGHKHQEKRAGD